MQTMCIFMNFVLVFQIITAKDSQRRLSLCSSVESETEEPESQEEFGDVLPVLSDYSELLEDPHLEKVCHTTQHCKIISHFTL